jgi:hypothetical protein
MSRYFVTDAPVAVPEWEDDPSIISSTKPNVIWVKAKMDVTTKGKVTSELFTMGKDNSLEARLGANETALLVHNIVRWDGPDFEGMPCTPDNIRKLDPTEPHVARVLEVIATRNAPPKSPKAQPGIDNSTTNGDTGLTTRPSQGSGNLQLASGELKSPLLNAVNGHLNRSEDLTRIS